jgi:hypothetical protein
LLNSYVLIFARDEKSKKIGKSKGINMELICDYHENHYLMWREFRLSDFPIYASHLVNVQRQMNDWRPETLVELATRPYRDPLTFYAFWFSISIGLVSIFALGGVLATTATNSQLS